MIENDPFAKQVFCSTFDACVVYDDDWDIDEGSETVVPENARNKVDCAALTECDWDGIHKGWIGDGVCHDNMDGCYNTAVCGYDGGDCCEDTCTVTDTSSYMECGHDGYACKDPVSDNCDNRLTTKCTRNPNNKPVNPVATKCKDDETKYRLVMYDSFGDGWDTTTLTIKPEGSDEITWKGGLVDGFQGTELICLSRTPQCYNVQAQGGTWGVEVSWEVKPMSMGKPARKYRLPLDAVQSFKDRHGTDVFFAIF